MPGLRYPVGFILEMLIGDTTPEELLAEDPDLEPEDLKAVYAYAARLSSIPRIEPLAV